MIRYYSVELNNEHGEVRTFPDQPTLQAAKQLVKSLGKRYPSLIWDWQIVLTEKSGDDNEPIYNEITSWSSVAGKEDLRP